MCDPGTLGMMAASAALSAGGAMVSDSERRANAGRVAHARSGVLREHLERQRKYGDEARGHFDNRMKDYEKPAQEQSLEKAQETRTADITKNVSAPTPEAIPLSGSAPQVVKGEVAKRILAAFGQATERAKAAGKLGGYGDNMLGNNFGVADTARRIGTVNNFSRNDAALLPAEQDFAEISATRPQSMWGPILQAGGSVLAAGAGRGWQPFGSGAPIASSAVGNPTRLGGLY